VVRVSARWKILTLPLFSMLAVALSIGIGLWFAALMVEYRDFRFIVRSRSNLAYMPHL